MESPGLLGALWHFRALKLKQGSIYQATFHSELCSWVVFTHLMFPKCQTCQMCNGNVSANAPASLQDAAWAPAARCASPEAALGMCDTKTRGRGAAPGPGAQEKLQKGGKRVRKGWEKGEKSPFLRCREWIRAALWASLHLTTDPPAQAPCQDQKDFWGGNHVCRKRTPGMGRVPTEELLSPRAEGAGYSVGRTLHTWCVLYIIYMFL